MNATSSIWYKLWLETRLRFWLALGLNLAVSLMYVVFRRHYYPVFMAVHPDGNYAQYLFLNIYKFPRGMYQFTGFIIGLSGWQRERRVGNLGFSLALPRSRTQQIFDRALFEAAQMVIISFGSLLSMWMLSNLLGHALPLDTTLIFAVLWTTGGLFVYALTFLCSIVCPNEYTAIAAAYIVYMVDIVITQMPRLQRYPLNDVHLMSGSLGNVIDRHTMLWTGHIPVLILAGHLAAAAALIAIAILIVKWQEL